ncbi:MAG: hypothetical protein R3Y56_07730 [Akkermansia sp.]
MPDSAAYMERKELYPTSLDTRGYTAALDAQVLERSFLMAGVTNAKILEKNKQMAEGILRGDLSPAEARKQLRMFYRDINYKPDPGTEGTIKDLSSARRMNATLETNRRMAQGWARREQYRGDYTMPGLELYRAGRANEPRDWWSRWQDAGASVNWQGASKAEMIALHDSPIWVALSEFGHAYPPFDWGSHMNIKPVSAERCEQLGLLSADEPDAEAEPEAAGLNEQLEVSLDGVGEQSRELLQKELGKLCSFTDKAVKVKPEKAAPSFKWRDVGRMVVDPITKGVTKAGGLLERWIAGSFDFKLPANPQRATQTPSDEERQLLASFFAAIRPIKSSDAEGGTMHRGLALKSQKAEIAFIARALKDKVYEPQDGVIAESWSANEDVALNFAHRNKTRDVSGVIIECVEYRSRRRIDGAYPSLREAGHLDPKNTKHPVQTEGESVMLSDVKFEVLGHRVDKKRGVTIITVKEIYDEQ